MRSADNIKSSRKDHPRSGQPNNMVIGKETFSSSAFQIMLSSATRKGQVTCIGLKRKKSKSRQTRSSFAFFDLNNKNLVPYNIKSFLRNSVSPYDVRSFGQSVSADGSINGANSLSFIEDGLHSGSSFHDDRYNRLPPVLDLSFRWQRGNPKSLDYSQGSAKLHKTKKYRDEYHFLTPEKIQSSLYLRNSWNWLSWNIEKKNPVTGRIARSLQRAGICILLGGFTGFLPYKEYTMRNRLISNYEGDLSSFQILALKKNNLNCILSKDRVTSSYNRRWNKI